MNVIKKSFRAEQFEMREQAILRATNHLLGLKGYDAMAMDDIASEVGIAKGSLYKHFSSKDELAAAVMTNLLRRTREQLEALGSQISGADSAYQKLRSMLQWILTERMAGGVPLLPSTSPVLQKALMANTAYTGELVRISDAFGALITEAQAAGQIRRDLRQEFILFTIYARSCDPTLDFLKMQGQMTPEEIVQHMVDGCFGGLHHA
jgi:AcrR family transcriptional regulator